MPQRSLKSSHQGLNMVMPIGKGAYTNLFLPYTGGYLILFFLTHFQRLSVKKNRSCSYACDQSQAQHRDFFFNLKKQKEVTRGK